MVWEDGGSNAPSYPILREKVRSIRVVLPLPGDRPLRSVMPQGSVLLSATNPVGICHEQMPAGFVSTSPFSKEDTHENDCPLGPPGVARSLVPRFIALRDHADGGWHGLFLGWRVILGEALRPL